MKIHILLLSMLLGCSVIAQDRTLVVIIDTVEFENKKTEGYELTIKPCGVFLNDKDIFLAQGKVSLVGFPNYMKTIDFPNEATTVEIPIDTSGSYVCLRNLNINNTDTLRINSIKIFDTKPIDSVFTHSYYYRKNNGEMSKKRFREKFKKEGSNFNPVPPPETIKMTINGIKYITPLKLEKADVINVRTGSGYNKRNPFNKNGEYKKRLKYFTYEQRKVQYLWRGSINLKEN